MSASSSAQTINQVPDFDTKSFDFSVYEDIDPIESIQPERYPFPVHMSWEYAKVMSLFRAVMNNQEKTERVLKLTERVIVENPTNVTAWWYRREVLVALNFDGNKELDFSTNILKLCLKSYQAWQHRKWVICHMNDPPSDTRFLRDLLYQDDRNFHAWSYIIWLSGFLKWHEEIYELTGDLVKKQRRNGSAWHVRIEMMKNIDVDMEYELNFVFNLLGTDGGNEACCNAVRGIVAMKPDLATMALEKIDAFLSKTANDRAALTLKLHLQEKLGIKTNREEVCQKLMRVDVLRKRFWKCVMENDPRFT